MSVNCVYSFLCCALEDRTHIVLRNTVDKPGHLYQTAQHAITYSPIIHKEPTIKRKYIYRADSNSTLTSVAYISASMHALQNCALSEPASRGDTCSHNIRLHSAVIFAASGS